MNKIFRWCRRNPLNAGLLGAIALSTAMSGGNLGQTASNLSTIRSLADQNNRQQAELDASIEAQKTKAEVAKARYQSGCVMVVASKDPQSFTSLSEGQPVIDSARKVPLPAGVVVCDALGMTGEIVPDESGRPVVGRMAFTGDQQVINAAKTRINAKYKAPSL